MRKPVSPYFIGFVLGTAAIVGQTIAHPGHGAAPFLPAPTWRMADGRVMSAFLMKAQDGRVWFVDEENRTQIVPIADLDASAQEAVRRTTSRFQIINTEQPEPRAAMPLALTGLLADASRPPAPMPQAARVFQVFERLKTRWDDKYLYVESDGLPDHPMMIGIRSWQQQVPIPQPYFGDNAWQIPLNPAPADAPAMIKGRFLRGAIALAVNGIPIFNPQNNRGEISKEIGELDQWGGHCGRGDDYHYHIVPMHLQKIVGKGMPIAYALDGYPIYGETEPDGSPAEKLDECHGHTTSIGYHYHASSKYPYVIGGFHGQVVERGGQVDPQPRDNPLRPALQPLRGATITGFKSIGKEKNQLLYVIGGRQGSVTYVLNGNGSYTFSFEDPQGNKQEQTYQRRDIPGGPPREDKSSFPGAGAIKDQKQESKFKLRSSAVTDGGQLPKEFTGDGAAATPPLEWTGAPATTKSYALVMHHIDPERKIKWYWILYDIPGDVLSIPKNVKDIGALGNNSVNGKTGYAPPHSKGPGAKTYILTLYALSAPPQLSIPPSQVDRAALLRAIEDRTLASAELKVIYDRTGVIQSSGASDPPAPGADTVKSSRGPGGGRSSGGDFHLIPRSAEDALTLTADQKQKLAALEQEMLEKLQQILTPEQIKTLMESRPPRGDATGANPHPD
jgi:phosphatidylethanolamine-binding protein (PEBP) family uncharacterized protein